MSGVYITTNQIRCCVLRDGQRLVRDLARKVHEEARLRVLRSIRNRPHVYYHDLPLGLLASFAFEGRRLVLVGVGGSVGEAINVSGVGSFLANSES